MTNDLAKDTISTIEKALEEEQTPAINEIIHIIQELASKAFSISVSELSQLIGRDTAITEKVISAANTLGFNPSGVPIATITEAIHTVGFEKIRNLAISILLVENAGHRLNAYEQREIAAMAVCSGLMAQKLMERSSRKIDPELAFVCTSLRNYGKLLMTTFLIDKYREAKSLAMDLQDDDEAFKQVFGLTPLRLGQVLLQSTSLPKSIMLSLKAVPDSVLAKAVETPEEEILVIAEMSVQLFERTFDESVSPEQFNDSLRDVLQKFSKSLTVDLETINQTLVEIDMELQAFNRAVGVSDVSSPASQKVRARVSGEELPERPAEARIKPLPKKKGLAEMSTEEKEEFAEEQHAKAVEKITNMMVPGSIVDLNDVYSSVAISIQAGLELENSMVFVAEEFEPTSFSARYGIGPMFEKIKNRPLISTRKKDVFSISIARREDILIQDIRAGKIKSVIPEWITTYSETNSFVVLPITLGQAVFAIIVGTISSGGSIRLEGGDLNRLKQLRTHLAKLKKLIDEHTVKLAKT